MNYMIQTTIQDMIQRLSRYGFQERTEAANKQNGMKYLCAFKRMNSNDDVFYCCVTVDDVSALLTLVEKAARQGRME
jgi:predicted transcriptional regulator